MGYDINRFVDISPETAENFKCAICLDIFENPREFSCGHIFCLECVEQIFDGGDLCDCPQCRQRIQLREVKQPNRILLDVLQNLYMKCEFADRGCTSKVKLENSNTHSHIKQCHFNLDCEVNLQNPTAPPLEPNNEDLLSLPDSDSNTIGSLKILLQIQDTFVAAISRITNRTEVEESVALRYESYEGMPDDNQVLIEDNENQVLIEDDENQVLIDDDWIILDRSLTLVQQLRTCQACCVNNISYECIFIALIFIIVIGPMLIMILLR